MKKYNKFILENNLRSGSKEIDYETLEELLLTRCKNFNPDNSVIKRFVTHFDNLFYYVDPTKHERVSANTKNYYTHIIDNSELWKDYPKRKNSLICRLNEKNNFHVIPFDNSIWGVCPKEDLWWCFKYGDINDIRINDYYSLQAFNDNLDDIYYIYFKKPLSDKNKNVFFSELMKLTKKLKSINNDKELANRIYNYDKFISDNTTNLHKYLFRSVDKGLDVREALEKFLNPSNFKLLNYEELINFSKITDKHECWTESTCLLVDDDGFDLVKKIYNER